MNSFAPTFVLLARLAFAQVPDGGAAPRQFQAADLASYFAQGARAQARAQLDAGNFAQARALLEGQGDSLPVRTLRAAAAEGASDFATAAAEWAALAKDYPALSDRCALHAGLAFEAAQGWDAAAAQFSSVDPGSLNFADARLGLARVLAQKKDLVRARQALAPVVSMTAPAWGRDVGAEALLALAALAHDEGDAPGETEALTRLWSTHPRSPLAAQAEARLGGAAKLPASATVARAEALVEAHQNRQGIDLVAPLLPKLKLPDPLACRAHFIHAKGLRKEREHTQAAAELVGVVDKCKDPDLRARALYTLGYSRAIVDVARAPAAFEQLVKDYPESSLADDALFYAADSYLKLGDKKRALARIDELALKYPAGDFLAEGLFKAFWTRRLAKQAPEALATLDQLEQRFADADESYEFERARYWKSRMAEEAGDVPKAVGLLEALATEHPATYYGFIARSRLATLAPERAAQVRAALEASTPAAALWPMPIAALGATPHFQSGVELVRLGYVDEAQAELAAVDRSGLGVEDLRLLVQVLSAAGDARTAHAVARASLRRDLSGPITALNRPVWEVAYPNAFRELIERHCKASGALDPDLLQALMREESALDPKALSWAGALGLTQLMPSTALVMSAQLKMKKVTNEMILDPDTNILLGATYLASLSRRYQGVNQFALAGYNAGESAVDRWRKERPGDEIDAWVEGIPLAETRGYLKRVLRSYNTYQLLYGAKPAAP
jgi:soluble lytic murein transglycosylase